MKRIILCLLAAIILFYPCEPSMAQTSNALTPVGVRDLLYGSPLNDLQRELIWKEKCEKKEIAGEGSFIDVQKTTPARLLGPYGPDSEVWVMRVLINKGDPVPVVFLILDDKSLSLASRLKQKDKVWFSGILKKSNGIFEGSGMRCLVLIVWGEVTVKRY